jgi:hypothetical protein
VKFPQVGRLLSKVHSELLQVCKTNYRASEAFGNLKKLLITSPVLAQPDIAMPFDVYCDTRRPSDNILLVTTKVP